MTLNDKITMAIELLADANGNDVSDDIKIAEARGILKGVQEYAELATK